MTQEYLQEVREYDFPKGTLLTKPLRNFWLTEWVDIWFVLRFAWDLYLIPGAVRRD